MTGIHTKNGERTVDTNHEMTGIPEYPAFGKKMRHWMANCHVDGVLDRMLNVFFQFAHLSVFASHDSLCILQ
jgi:hypothetical protein